MLVSVVDLAAQKPVGEGMQDTLEIAAAATAMPNATMTSCLAAAVHHAPGARTP
jgi:hypothetical protein